MAQVVIQHVHSIWTKQSRGGENARIRNAVPAAVALPPDLRPATFMLHHAEYAESSDFVQSNTVKSADDFAALDIRDLEITLTTDVLSVRFLRDGNNAACPSPYPHADVFALSESQWGRLTYNGRYTAWNTGNWWYEKTVYNIGWLSEVDRSVFVRTEPTCEFSEMARLR